MINVDDRLIRKELKKIGVDAFAVLLCITSHLGKSSTAWPGIARLREMTGLSKEKAYAAIRKLIECGMVERKQENEKGVWGKVVYRVTTEYLNIYVPASAFALSEPLAGNPYSGNP
ncbi:MAG: helix-turn-helix domain-containing protein, partial [Phaeodactylibacter sp.]|nr:helix-turn-helix domain-containing protein [Phaeodactylibacter sp.]